ncbi:MAG: hypothetical protein AAFQ94_16940 [Bacteroidota bacterium]
MTRSLPEILNPLSHSGTSQYERMADELSFDYVRIEERHESDFLNYAARLAETITYYDQNNIPAGNWRSFFDGNTSTNVPHKALFIAFVRLLEALNEHANSLLPDHLNYQYEEVLRFTRKNASARKAHLFFKCAKTLTSKFLEKGTQFVAGTGLDGKEILFKIVDEIVINKTVLSACLSTFKHSEQFGERIFTKDFTDQLIDDQINEGLSVFGESQLTYEKITGEFEEVFKEKRNFTMREGKIGFSLSSSMLRLREGRRKISLKLCFIGSIPDFNKSQFLFSFTAENGWHQLQTNQVSVVKAGNGEELHFDFEIANTDPAIFDFDTDIHGGQYQSDYPVFSIILKHDTIEKYAYSRWKNARIDDVKLKVAAEGVRSLIFQNESSQLEASKPFSLFGLIPAIGDHFYVGHQDIFNEKLESLNLNIKWKDIPELNFSTYYQNYAVQPSNTAFKVKKAVLDRKEWHSFNSVSSIFHPQNAGFVSKIDFNLGALSSIERKTTSQAFDRWDYTVAHGFIRLTLSGPDIGGFRAFGHNLYNQAVRNNVNSNNIVNQPYTPIVEQITLDYETEEVSFINNQLDYFYHEWPFGQRLIQIEGMGNPKTLLPSLSAEGTAFIGLKNLKPPQSISMLFQLKSGSGDAAKSQVATGINWFYLEGDEWVTLDRLRISQDTSSNLLHSGILKFDLPATIDDRHHIMPDGHFWLKAEMTENAASIDLLQSIHLQAVVLEEETVGISEQPIAPQTMKKPKSGSKGIALAMQPYASFEGKKAESQLDLYRRAHERLRHKNRAIAIWDYERVVLEEFPDLYKVKCLNHTDEVTEVAAGNVMVAVIPDLKNKVVTSPFQPKLSSYQRVKIYDFLRVRISPFIHLRVVNPVYEPLSLSMNVGFYEGFDEGFYGKKLHRQIQEFLSPWAFENHDSYGKGLAFGGELHKSTILKFVEDLPYVDFVNDFTMYHRYQDASVAESFENEILNKNGVTDHRSVETIGAYESFKIAFGADDPSRLTALIALEVRFLKGLLNLTDQQLHEKFLNQFIRSLESKRAEGKTITKTLIKSILKTLYYVDKLFAVSFHLELPDGEVLEEVDVANAKTSGSVMVTSEQHRIGVYRAGDYKCEGNVLIGIGVMIVEADFIVSPIKTSNNEYQTR